MRLLEELLREGEQPCGFRYRPVKLDHLVAGVCYGIAGEWADQNGRPAGQFVLPDVSCDYLFVSRLAAKCTAAQLDPDQLLELLDRRFV